MSDRLVIRSTSLTTGSLSINDVDLTRIVTGFTLVFDANDRVMKATLDIVPDQVDVDVLAEVVKNELPLATGGEVKSTSYTLVGESGPEAVAS